MFSRISLAAAALVWRAASGLRAEDAAAAARHAPESGAAAAKAADEAAHGEAQAAHGEGHAAHGGAHAADDNPLAFISIKRDLALWTALIFLVLLTVLWRFAWGPIAKGLDRREQMIADQIAEAERSNDEARRLLVDYQQKLGASQDEVRVILEQARRDAEASGRELLDHARSEAQREHQKALREIEQAKDGALKELAERSANLAVELAGKIVGARLKPEDHRALIEKSLADFPKPGNN
jgi:F-type H+-transporting ATPase subunit b